MKQLRGRADFFRMGDWNAICYRCGRKRKASEMKKQWQGYWVCEEHWEPRHPQDFVRDCPPPEPPPWLQPPPKDIFVGGLCTVQGRQAIPHWAIPGCAIPSYYLGGAGIAPPPGPQPPPPGPQLPGPFCTQISIRPEADLGAADCATVTV